MLSRLAQGFPESDSSRHRHVERASLGRQGDPDAHVSCGMYVIGDTCRFATEQKRIIRSEHRGCECCSPFCRKQDQTAARAGLRVAKVRPAVMTDDFDAFPIVHRRSAERFVVQREAARLDNVDCDAKARRQSKICPEILRDVRLKDGESHFRRVLHAGGLSCDTTPRGGFLTRR